DAGIHMRALVVGLDRRHVDHRQDFPVLPVLLRNLVFELSVSEHRGNAEGRAGERLHGALDRAGESGPGVFRVGPPESGSSTLRATKSPSRSVAFIGSASFK